MAELDIKTGRSDVGVILVNYNAGNFLAECVERILNQVERVVVVDNASHDDSLELLENRLVNGASVEIVRNDSNLGFASACNIGARKLSNPILLFLNPDCLLEVATIEALILALNSDRQIGMVGGLLQNPDGSEQPGGRRAVPTPWRSFVRAFGLSKLSKRWPSLFSDFYLHEQPLPDHPVEVEAISGACMLVKRDAVEDVGMWDEKYFLHCEDLDWCMRFRQMGWKVMFVPAAKMTHIQGVSCRNRKIFVEWHKHKGMMRFYRKFFRHQYPGVLMWLVALGVWLRFGFIVVSQSRQKVLRVVGLVRE